MWYFVVIYSGNCTYCRRFGRQCAGYPVNYLARSCNTYSLILCNSPTTLSNEPILRNVALLSLVTRQAFYSQYSHFNLNLYYTNIIFSGWVDKTSYMTIKPCYKLVLAHTLDDYGTRTRGLFPIIITWPCYNYHLNNGADIHRFVVIIAQAVLCPQYFTKHESPFKVPIVITIQWI